jgi:hypothetical protein
VEIAFTEQPQSHEVSEDLFTLPDRVSKRYCPDTTNERIGSNVTYVIIAEDFAIPRPFVAIEVHHVFLKYATYLGLEILMPPNPVP